jgi:hypothetical protein
MSARIKTYNTYHNTYPNSSQYLLQYDITISKILTKKEKQVIKKIEDEINSRISANINKKILTTKPEIRINCKISLLLKHILINNYIDYEEKRKCCGLLIFTICSLDSVINIPIINKNKHIKSDELNTHPLPFKDF